MLAAPEPEPERQALDRRLIDAVNGRLAAGPWVSRDAEVMACRDLLASVTDPRARSLIQAVCGRTADASPLVACGVEALSLASDRFGSPARVVAEPEAALDLVRSGQRAAIDLIGARPWWGRLLALPQLSVRAALPDDASQMPRVLVVEAGWNGPTGGDRTFWVTDALKSDARVARSLAEQGLIGTLAARAGGLNLFILTGYVQADDARLEHAPGVLKGVIGAAPVF